MAEEGILLESGTNELELLEFLVGNQSYGINVAKIRELCPYQVPTPIPNSHPFIEGVFMPRDEIISVINLAKALSISVDESAGTGKDMYIVTNFNKLHTAFHVQRVLGIHRISWTEIIKPDSTISNSSSAVATGIVRINDKITIVLDFEKIVSEINPETGLKMSDLDSMLNRNRHDVPILLAEDSALLLEMLKKCLTQAGQEAWDRLENMMENGAKVGKDICMVITDIEMPQMDGHHLTKLIKTDEQLKNIPVIIFSSLINEQMRAKGELLGADAQLSKPEIGQLVGEIDKLINAQK